MGVQTERGETWPTPINLHNKQDRSTTGNGGLLDNVAEVRSQRGQSGVADPPKDATRDQVAEWIARKHLAVDTGITDVWYLPDNAPGHEIRLVEVNALLAGLPDEDVAPVDFGFNVDGLHFILLVVDVTPSQWERIQKA